VFRAGFFQSGSVDFSGRYGAERRNQNAEPGPRAAVVMATGAVTVKEATLLRAEVESRDQGHTTCCVTLLGLAALARDTRAEVARGRTLCKSAHLRWPKALLCPYKAA